MKRRWIALLCVLPPLLIFILSATLPRLLATDVTVILLSERIISEVRLYLPGADVNPDGKRADPAQMFVWTGLRHGGGTLPFSLSWRDADGMERSLGQRDISGKGPLEGFYYQLPQHAAFSCIHVIRLDQSGSPIAAMSLERDMSPRWNFVNSTCDTGNFNR